MKGYAFAAGVYFAIGVAHFRPPTLSTWEAVAYIAFAAIFVALSWATGRKS